MKPLLWIIAALLLVAAAMLIAGIGEAVVWFAVIALGVAVVIIGGSRTVRRRDVR